MASCLRFNQTRCGLRRSARNASSTAGIRRELIAARYVGLGSESGRGRRKAAIRSADPRGREARAKTLVVHGLEVCHCRGRGGAALPPRRGRR